MASSVLPLSKLVPKVRRLRRQGKRIGFTNGCFDLLHAGHLGALERLRRRCDVLIVGVNSDSSVRQLKGRKRPLVSQKQRARLVAGLKPVDWVTLFSESTPLRVIRALRPDLLGKGGDWKVGQVIGASFVRSYGGKVVILPYLKGHSTSGLVARIRKS